MSNKNVTVTLNLDLELLKQQKALIYALSTDLAIKDYSKEIDAIEGIVSLIDAIEDGAR